MHHIKQLPEKLLVFLRAAQSMRSCAHPSHDKGKAKSQVQICFPLCPALPFLGRPRATTHTQQDFACIVHNVFHAGFPLQILERNTVRFCCLFV